MVSRETCKNTFNGHQYVLLSPFFFPEQISTGKYNYFLAKRLIEKGAEVTVFCSHPLYPEWYPRPYSENVPGMKIVRGGDKVRYPRSPVLRRAVLELWYFLFLVRNRKRILKGDVIVAIYPPGLFLLCKWLFVNKPVVGIVHDLQATYAKKQGGAIGGLVQWATRFVEKRAFWGCSRLIFLSRAMAARAEKEYGLDARKNEVCYPFVSTDFPRDVGNNLLELFDPRYRHVVYSGALGEKQSPRELLRFFKQILAMDNDVVCHIFSRGGYFEELREQSAGVWERRLMFHDLVDERDLPELYNRSNLQIIPQQSGSSDSSLPSKLPNLLAAGVPVFVVTDEKGELAELLADVPFALVVHSWDDKKIAEQFLGFLRAQCETTHEDRQKAIRSFVETTFSIENVLEFLIRECQVK